MKRRVFIKKYGVFALSILSGSSTLTACQTVKKKYSNVIMNSKKELVVRKSVFDQQTHVLLEHPFEKHPIFLVKMAGVEYSASLMKCTHQHCTTELVENSIVCPCHGALFALNGDVLKGPAKRNLQTFLTRDDSDYIYVLVG